MVVQDSIGYDLTIYGKKMKIKAKMARYLKKFNLVSGNCTLKAFAEGVSGPSIY